MTVTMLRSTGFPLEEATLRWLPRKSFSLAPLYKIRTSWESMLRVRFLSVPVVLPDMGASTA